MSTFEIIMLTCDLNYVAGQHTYVACRLKLFCMPEYATICITFPLWHTLPPYVLYMLDKVCQYYHIYMRLIYGNMQ